jgi:hypothetical protein
VATSGPGGILLLNTDHDRLSVSYVHGLAQVNDLTATNRAAL